MKNIPLVLFIGKTDSLHWVGQKCHWILTQQHAATVIWMVFRPGWQTRFKYKGRCELLFSPRSMTSGVAFADTWTLAGQFVFIWRSSWWKHFNCTSRSDLLWRQNSILLHHIFHELFPLFSSNFINFFFVIKVS